jgi:hypothetical protein
MSSSEEFKSISELKKLRAANCKIEKIHPTVFASDAEVNAGRDVKQVSHL